MKTIITITFCLLTVIYGGNPTITFKSFSIVFEEPNLSFVIIFLAMALICYFFIYENMGYKKGVKDGAQAMLEYLKKQQDEDNQVKNE